nr:hypothetical protein [Candidatus Sigynarchaeota archaeon]
MTITVVWIGTEAITLRAISGDMPQDTIGVNMQAQALVTITNLMVAPPGPYGQGSSFSLTVTFSNAGGTSATVDAILDDGTYTDLTWSNPTAVVVVAGGTNMQLFTVNVGASAAANASVDIHVTWSGNEAISNRAISGDTPVDQILVGIQSQANVAITNLAVAPASPFVAGTAFTLTVTFINVGGLGATVDATMDDGSYTGLVWNDPAAVIVNSGGSTNTQTFTVNIAAGAVANGSVDIHVTWSGTEEITLRAISGDTPVDQILIAIQTIANVAITNLSCAPVGPYVGGMGLTLTATYSNTGGTAATVDGACTGQTYTFLTFSDPVAVVVNAGGTNTQAFTVTIAAGATTNVSVDIHVTWTGNEAITNRAISGDTPVDQILVSIQLQASVTITGLALSPIAAPGPYVGGMSFTLTVTFSNTGDTAATVDATMDDGIYTSLSWTDPAAVVVNAGGTNTQAFTVTAAAGAMAAFVTITVMWTGSEVISNRAISGDMPQDTINVNMQAQALVTITNLAVAPPGPYGQGSSFTLTVTYGNAGGTSGTVDAILDDGTYTDLTWDNPVAVTVLAGGTNMQVFTVNVGASAAANASVDIHVIWMGTESISARAISGDIPVDQLLVAIQLLSNVTITNLAVAPASPFVAGMTFALTVTFTNMGDFGATVDATMDDGTYTGLAWNDPAAVIVTSSGGTNTQTFTVNVAVGAASNPSVAIRVTWSGIEEITLRSISGDIPIDQVFVAIQSQAVVSITNLTPTPAGPYVGGMSFTLIVTYSNTGGTAATVDATMDDGTYTGLSWNDPAAVVVNQGDIITQTFTVTIAVGTETNASVDIHVIWSGQEAITNRAINGDTPVDQVLVSIQSQGNVAITNLAITPPSPFIAGESFTLTMTCSNTGGTAVLVDGECNAQSYTFLMFSDPAAVVVSAGGTNTQSFTVIVTAGAMPNASVDIHVTWTGIEAISGRSMIGDIPIDQILVEIQAHSNVVITDIMHATGNGNYVAGMAFIARVNFSNLGFVNATNVTAMVNFGGYLGLTSNVSASIVVAGNGGTGCINFLISIAMNAVTNNTVQIHAAWNGTEQGSGSSVSGTSGAIYLSISIKAQANLTITGLMSPSGPGPFVCGMSFVVRVSMSNPASLAIAINIIAALNFNGAIGLVANASEMKNISGAGFIDFLVTISTSMPSQLVSINASIAGNEEFTGRTLNAVSSVILEVRIQSQANLTITSIMYRTGNGTYNEGMTFPIRVIFSNTGGTAATSVMVTINFATYSYLSVNGTNPITIANGSMSFVDFLITVNSYPTFNSSVLIRSTWTGIEAISGRILTGSSANTVPPSLNVGIKPIPHIQAASNISYELTLTGHYLTWVVNEGITPLPFYTIYRNGRSILTGMWSPGYNITINVDNFAEGIYNFTIAVTDGIGGIAQSSAFVTILPIPLPVIVYQPSSNITFAAGTMGQSLSWTFTGRVTSYANYTIYRDTVLVASGAWGSNVPIMISLDGLYPGTYLYRIIVFSSPGNFVEDSVVVIVTDAIIIGPTLSLGIVAMALVPFLGIAGIMMGQSVGERRRLKIIASTLPTGKKVSPGLSSYVEQGKVQLSQIEHRLSEIKTRRQQELEAMQHQFQEQEKKLEEDRIRRRLEFQTLQDAEIQPLQDVKAIIDAEIQQKTQLHQDFTALSQRKSQIEANIAQLRADHAIRIQEISQQIRKEESTWAQKRAEKKRELEETWQRKINEMEEERVRERQRLESQIAQEESRNLQLQRRDQLADQRRMLIDQIKTIGASTIEAAEAQVLRMGDHLKAFYNQFNTDQAGNQDILAMETKISDICTHIANQEMAEKELDEISAKVMHIDRQIQSLATKMEMQRASPVLNLPGSRRSKNIFTTIQEIDFLCETCHKSVLTVEVPERKRWIKWTLAGLKCIVNAGGTDTLGEKSKRLATLRKYTEQDGGSDNPDDITERVNQLRELLPSSGDDIDSTMKAFAQEILAGSARDQPHADVIAHNILDYRLFFQEIVKKWNVSDVLSLLEKKEKSLWQLFSQNEQEDIRQFLKTTGHSGLYTNILQLRHGLYTCEECRKWLDDIEAKEVEQECESK